jgi:hypothetical protein
MHGEGAIAAESRPRKRSSAEVPATPEVRMAAAEMPSTTTEVDMTTTAMEMRATAMTPATAAAATMTTTTAAAAFRRGISGGREHGCENEDGKPEFQHGTPHAPTRHELAGRRRD